MSLWNADEQFYIQYLWKDSTWWMPQVRQLKIDRGGEIDRQWVIRNLANSNLLKIVWLKLQGLASRKRFSSQIAAAKSPSITIYVEETSDWSGNKMPIERSCCVVCRLYRNRWLYCASAIREAMDAFPCIRNALVTPAALEYRNAKCPALVHLKSRGFDLAVLRCK